MIRKILIPIRGDGKGENVLAHAAAMARRFDAHIDAVHCRPTAVDMMPYGVPIPAYLRDQISSSAKSVADEEESKLRGLFDRLVGELGLNLVDAPNGATPPSVSWREVAGKQVDVIKTHGRLADLIMVAKPDRARVLGENTLKSALFQTGRPVMMCPPREPRPQVLGERVSIAWSGSTEAARAVAMTLDIIQKAGSVTVLTADHEEIHGASAEDLVKYLEARGVAATLERFPAEDIGKSLLKRSAELGCDLMIMGAYGDSYERETIFGGNTQVVVDNAESPVIMVH